MKIIAVSGYKDSGKTTLCRELIRVLVGCGFSVGYIKRANENVTSSAGTDSGSVTAVVGAPALLWGNDGFRMEIASSDNSQPDPYAVAGKFFPDSDIVIIEGGNDLAIPKIWVSREGENTPDAPGILAVYDRYQEGDGECRYGVNDLDSLASAIADKLKLSSRSARVYVGCHELPMKDFVADFISGGLMGMIGSLKKPDDTEDVRVFIKTRKPVPDIT